jgi:ectoine hydroxylase
MQLTSEQLKTYEDQGYLLLPNCFSPAEVEVMKAEAADMYASAKDRPKALDKDGSVRVIHAVHVQKEVFQRLVHHPNIVKPLMQMLDSSVYVHQANINFKAAFENAMWQWHQDYTYFWELDGIPTARMANAIVFLDEVNEFNGPILLIPGSHKEGIISIFSEEEQSFTNRRLTYAIERKTVAKLVEKYGITAPKGQAGSIIFFHPSCVHSSAPNIISPFNRTIVVINYNSVENVPAAVENPRPEYFASRDYRPIDPLSEDTLLSPPY